MTTLGLGSGIGEGGRYTENTEYGALRNRICSRQEKEWGVHSYFCYLQVTTRKSQEAVRETRERETPLGIKRLHRSGWLSSLSGMEVGWCQ